MAFVEYHCVLIAVITLYFDNVFENKKHDNGRESLSEGNAKPFLVNKSEKQGKLFLVFVTSRRSFSSANI